MKRSMINLTFAAAVLMVASTVASAQTLKAQIPFSFHANGVVMAPGSYDLTASQGEHRIQLRNAAAHASVFLSSGIEADAPNTWRKAGKPTLEFSCSDGNCTLTRLWTATQAAAHVYSAPRNKEGRTIASIRVVTVSLN